MKTEYFFTSYLYICFTIGRKQGGKEGEDECIEKLYYGEMVRGVEGKDNREGNQTDGFFCLPGCEW